jgi:RecB family exonuclease
MSNPNPTNWMDRAACRPDPAWGDERRKTHLALFFPARGQSQAAGLAYCARCPVATECGAAARANDEEYGMWAGKLHSRGNTKTQPDIDNDDTKEPYMIPRTLSASSIQKYLACPAGWKAEYIEGARMPSGSAAAIGTVCHTCFEVWVKDGHYMAGHSNPKSVMKAIYDEAYWSEFADASRYDDGLDMVNKWLLRQNWDGRTVISTESKEHFDIPTTAGPIAFTYIMDRLDMLDGGTPEIVDYKSLSQPVQPQDLKNKPQCRIYALAVQLKYPEADKVWMTFDMLRFDAPISIVFTKEENRATWTWLCAMAQKIVDDDTALETLNDECRWCVRKSVCKKLQAHADAGGPLAITDPVDAAARHYDISRQIKALSVHQDELTSFLLDHMKRADAIEDELGGRKVLVTVSARRAVDDDRLRAVIGNELMAKYGAMTMKKLDAMMAGDELDPDMKAEVKKLISRNFGDPSIRVEKVAS